MEHTFLSHQLDSQYGNTTKSENKLQRPYKMIKVVPNLEHDPVCATT